MHKKTIHVFIHVPGDKSLGIRPVVYLAECDKALLYTVEQRELTREVFRQCYSSLEEGNPHVVVLFEDECQDCGRIECKGECVASEVNYQEAIDGRR